MANKRDFERGLIFGLASGETLSNLVVYWGAVNRTDKIKTNLKIVKNTIIDEDITKKVVNARDIVIDDAMTNPNKPIKEISVDEKVNKTDD